MKVVIIGVNHAGTSALRTLLTQKPDTEVVAFDRNTNISFLGCGIALAVGGEVKNPEDLFYANLEKLTAMGASICMNHEVISIDVKEKWVKAKNLDTGETVKESYDKLIYAGGSWPIDMKGISEENKNLENVEICKWFQHAQQLIEKAGHSSIKKVSVVGSGYIGIELAEAFAKRGKEVTLIDCASRVLPSYFDPEFTQPLEKDIEKAGIKLALKEMVTDFKGVDGKVSKIITDKGEYECDMVISCIGFNPCTSLLPTAEKTSNGALKVDAFMRTSIPDVYALGDSCALYHAAQEEHVHVALATNAVKSGIVAASHLAGSEAVKLESIAGTNAICVFGHRLASTGLNEECARKAGFDTGVSYVEDNDRPEFMPKYDKVAIKLVYDKKNLRLLGAQIGSSGEREHTEIIFYLALAIQKRMTLAELAFADVYFLNGSIGNVYKK